MTTDAEAPDPQAPDPRISAPAPRVSVVCAWYNRADYLRDTVDSLLAQDFDSFEIVLVNDGSPDPRVREILESYADPRLRAIHQENTGFVRAIRRAIEESRAPFIAVMGAGDVCHPSRLRLQHETLSAREGHVGVSCLIRNVIVGGPHDGETMAAETRVRDVTREIILREGNQFSHGEVMFRRSVYDAVGGYRLFFKFSQDLDLWLRMTRFGPFAVRPEVLYDRRAFASDGIAASLNKTTIQTRLARIAIQCAREYDRYGYDMVEIFGADAGLFRKSDRFMSRALAKTSIKCLRAGLAEDAALHADLALREGVTGMALLAKLLCAAEGAPALRGAAEALARRLPVRDKRQAATLLPARRAGTRGET